MNSCWSKLARTNGKKNITCSNLDTFFQLPEIVSISLHGSFRTEISWQRKMQSTEKGLWSNWMLSTQTLCIIDYPCVSNFLTFFLLTMLCGPGDLCSPLSSIPFCCFRRILFHLVTSFTTLFPTSIVPIWYSSH